MTDTQDTQLAGNGLQEATQPAEQVGSYAETAATEPTEEQAAEETGADAPAPTRKPDSPAEIASLLKEMAAQAELPAKAEVDALKQAFYKLHNAQVEQAKEAFVANGGAAEEFVPASDPAEEEVKQALATIRQKRSEANAEIEKQREMNYQVKLSIIEELKDLIASPDDPNKNYAEFKKLQQQWNETTLIPQSKSNELWKNYQLHVEKFYDLLKLSNEFREYDFKKNLEAKVALCEAAEKLAEATDVISAFHQLQKLHQEYRDTGPVAKELREEIWTRFKAASSVVNRRHQQHFESLKKAEQDNLDKKTVICEIMEAIDTTALNGFKAWEEKTKEVIALQEKWKGIGYAPQKMNVKIFERFRKACDAFFQQKSDFYKAAKAKMNENLEKKRALCEKAEELKNSQDWKATAEELVNLQKEWKAIGAVPRKVADQLWNRFVGACDHFFEEKNKAVSAHRSAESQNLEKKRGIIKQLEDIAAAGAGEENAQQVRELMSEWNSVGFVPFKEKAKVNDRYRALLDELLDRTDTSASRPRGGRVRTGSMAGAPGNATTGNRERDRLARTCEILQAELHTYENNLGFLNTSSKSGSNLLNELNRKMEKLREELAEVRGKIKAMDEEAAKQE